jgi:hypothetical protein
MNRGSAFLQPALVVNNLNTYVTKYAVPDGT